MDYKLTVKIQNNKILSLIESNGYSSVNAFCNAHGLNVSSVGQIINFKISPLLQNGDYRKIVWDMATALSRHPDHLFTEEQRTLKLESNTAERVFSESRINELLLTDEVLDPLTNLITHEDNMEVLNQVKSVVETLTPRERDIITKTFGLNGNPPMNPIEIRKDYDVTFERIQMIYDKAMRKLKHEMNANKKQLKVL